MRPILIPGMLALALAPAAHAADLYTTLPGYLAAGLPLADITGYAPSHQEASYPTGFTSGGVTITGADLTGVGSDFLGAGQPEMITSSGPLTISFQTTHAFGFYLAGPGDWHITPDDGEGTFGIGTASPGLFFGISDATAFDNFVISSVDGGPVNLLTTPPQVPEPASLPLLAMAAVATIGAARGFRGSR